jgi:hypothetical protein
MLADRAGQQRDGRGRIGGDRRLAEPEQHRKGEDRAAAGDGIHHARAEGGAHHRHDMQRIEHGAAIMASRWWGALAARLSS